MTQTIEIRRKRLLYRCRHRGTKELDLLLGGFADRELAAMGAADLDRFEALLEVPEPDLHAWLSGQGTLPPEFDHPVARRLIAFKFVPGSP